MNTKKTFISLGLTLSVLLLQTRVTAANFNFNLDATPDNTLSAPFVGTGTLSYSGNVADGTYALTALSDYDLTFTFGSNIFRKIDITTTLSTIQVIISGGGTQANFSNTSAYGNGGYNGSIDFVNTSNPTYRVLSLEALGIAPTNSPLSRYSVATSTKAGSPSVLSGNYTESDPSYVPTTSVPAPPSVLGLAFLGGSALLAQSKRRKTSIAETNT